MPDSDSGNQDMTPSGLVGRTLGQNRLLEKVGEGGMGTVFRARDTALDRVVAIKVLPPDLARDEQYRVRFLREARALARVKHPNLVPIYAVAEERGVYYFAMEFVEGESLRRRIATKEPMQLQEILRVCGQVLSALAAVHATGITHRDVKSQNIMLEPSGRAVLMDLGLAKDETSQAVTTAGMILGTPEFMSPEQAEGVPATPLSDIYSFGIVLYEMAAGDVPFRGKSAIAVLRQQVDSVAAPLSEVRPDLPPAFSRAVALALQKKPEDRPENAAALAMFLLRAGRTPELETLSGSAPGAGAVTAGTKPVARPGATHATRAQSTAETVVDAGAKPAPGTGLASRAETVAARAGPAGRKLGKGFVAGLAVGAVVLVVLLALAYERLTRPEVETKPAAVAKPDEKPAEPPAAAKRAGRRANVLARDGTALWRNVRVVGATEEGVVIEEADGNRRTLPYDSSPRIEYLHGDEAEGARKQGADSRGLR